MGDDMSVTAKLSLQDDTSVWSHRTKEYTVIGVRDGADLHHDFIIIGTHQQVRDWYVEVGLAVMGAESEQ
jgi:hypothetical protein